MTKVGQWDLNLQLVTIAMFKIKLQHLKETICYNIKDRSTRTKDSK